MSYVSKTLGTNEHITHTAKFHWIYLVQAWLLLLLVVALGFYMPTPMLLVTTVGAIAFVKMMITYYFTERVLTEERCIYKRGLISRKTEEINVKRMEEINLKQSILGRILGYGTVIISGTGSSQLLLKDLDAPLVFMKALNNVRHK